MLAVFIFNYFTTFKLFTYLWKKSQYFQKYAYLLHVLFTLFLVFFHLTYYIKSREKNYFELMGINRLFTLDELNAQNKMKLLRLEDESKEKLEKLKTIYGTLEHVIYCQLYDKYQKEDNNQEDLVFNTLNIAKIMQNLMEYLITFIVICLATKEENLKGCRKWIAAVMLMFFSNEMNMYLSKREHFDWFFDSYFSQMAIFDRILLIRFCMIPCLLTIRLNYVLFNKSSFLKVSDQIRQTLNTQNEISKRVIKQENGVQCQNLLKMIENNIRKSIDKIDGEHLFLKEKEIKKKTGCSQCYKITLYILIAFIILMFFADTKFEMISNGDRHDEN